MKIKILVTSVVFLSGVLVLAGGVRPKKGSVGSPVAKDRAIPTAELDEQKDGQGESSSVSRKKKPNVIYILADDLGYGDLSCFGNQKLKTPHIDRLASEGLKLTRHYSANTVCTPSRHSLMTGQHAGHCLARGNGNENVLALLPEMITLPEVFQAAGYQTGLFGKWGLGDTDRTGRSSPLTHGFNEFSAWKNQLIAHTYYPSSIVRNGKEEPLESGTYIHDVIMKDAMVFMKKNIEQGQPFFCYIPTAIPHAAMHAPKHLHEKYRAQYPEYDEVIGRYSAGPTEECADVQNPVAGFAGMMEHFDQQIGGILAFLKKEGVERDTIILFSSDNGAHLEGGHKAKFWDSNGPLRGYKRDLYEGGIRAPSMVYWPSVIRAGRESDHLSTHYDILATMCDLLGEPVPEQSNGISMLPLLLEQGEQKQHDHLYWEFFQGHKMRSQALREGEWKLILNHFKTKKIKGSGVELYHLKKDLGEKENLAEHYPERVARMKALINEVRRPWPLAPSGQPEKTIKKSEQKGE